MDWTSLYLKTSDLNVFILGTGEVATRRANRFLDHGACVRLAGNALSEELFDKGAELYSTDDVDELNRLSENDELSGYLKKAAVAPFDGICSGDITVIEAKPDYILPELLPFVIQNDAFFDFFAGLSGAFELLSPIIPGII